MELKGPEEKNNVPLPGNEMAGQRHPKKRSTKEGNAKKSVHDPMLH